MVGHLVHRLTVEVKFADRQQAERSMTRLTEAAEQLTADIEGAFDKVAAARTLRLERLELDLGTVAEGELADLVPRARRALAEALLPYRTADSSAVADPDTANSRNQVPQTAEKGEPAEEKRLRLELS